jgi:hypothetical protein
MNLNIYYVIILVIDSIFMSIWKIAEGIMVCMFPMSLPYNREEIEIEFLEIRGIVTSPNPDTIYEEIDDIDYVFQQREPVQHTYYIGSYVYLPGNLVMGSVVSSDAFFRYTHQEIHHYLVGYHLSPSPEHAVHIVQLTEKNANETEYGDITLGQVYFYNLPVIVKTYWIRIVQRTWKRVYREKMRVIAIRKSLKSIRGFEETGQYPAGARSMPSIWGMLSFHNI